ncbi:hypothetical protein COV82_01835 [Candidatus Peregrinibacteria bacterium CG11_big_fil_rev_8_21_14_0_20_46_8]|nr:MAG: hypothetical protein COV82_01835 [Candidatus Peregrinibacteria bacterium CG11_big_fil_rev_8_21_14_0_20_46_8]
MIDTVRLTIPDHNFIIVNPERFDPPATDVLGYTIFGAHGTKKWIQNFGKRAGRYMPKLTIIKRLIKGGKSVTLNIECSLPKLIFEGSNFDELEDSDFSNVVKTLHECVEKMGIKLIGNPIESAIVSAIHFSKNISFLDYTTVSSVLKYVEKANISRRLDLNTKRFDNGGSAVYFYAKSHAFVLYDKIQDLKQPKGRGVEDNTFHAQMDIFDEIRRVHRQPLEILRLEYRLLNRVKLKAALKIIGAPGLTTFRELFSARLSHKLLQHYWVNIMDSLKYPILSESLSVEEVVREVLRQQKWHATPSKTLQIIGCYYGIRELGMRSFNGMFNKYFSVGSIYRTLAQMNDLEFKQSQKFDPFNHIGKELSEFKPLKMKDLVLPF